MLSADDSRRGLTRLRRGGRSMGSCAAAANASLGHAKSAGAAMCSPPNFPGFDGVTCGRAMGYAKTPRRFGPLAPFEVIPTVRVLHLSAGNLYGGIERLLVSLAQERGHCAAME